MTNHEKLRRKPLLFRMFTGLSADEFDQSDRYRNPLRRHTVMMTNVAGLHNRMYG